MRARRLETREEGNALSVIRRVLLAILTLGLLGTGAELLLLGHYEEARQLIPVVLVAASLLAVAWHVVAGGAASIRALQATMVLAVCSGFVGVVLHYRGNREFQLETDPSLVGARLFWKVMQAKAPPALAPAAMTELGLLGLAYTYRHPALARSAGSARLRRKYDS